MGFSLNERVRGGHENRPITVFCFPHVPIEPLDGIGRFQGNASNHLHRHETFHAAVLCFEHQAHPALAEFVEDDILAKWQPLGLALVQRLSLVLRQFLGLHQLAGEGFAIFRAFIGRQIVLKLSDIRGGHQAAVGQVLDELFQSDGHKIASEAFGRVQPVTGDYNSTSMRVTSDL